MLSVARYGLSVTTISYNSVGYAIFGGGYANDGDSYAIDVFYINSDGTFSKLSTSLTLSVNRRFLAATTISYNGVDYAIFAGGSNDKFSNAVDIFYFNSSGTFSKLTTGVTLSVARRYLAATTISHNGVDYAVFAGGYNNSFNNTIDVLYFNSNGTFSNLDTKLALSVGRNFLVATTISHNGVDYAIFGGGHTGSNFSNAIDVFYFNSSGTFSKLSTSVTLSIARRFFTVATISGNGIEHAIFAGGYNGSYINTIDVFYFNSDGTFSRLNTPLTLSVARRYLTSTTVSYNGVDYAIFAGGDNDSYINTIDVFYFNSDGIFSKLDTPLTLSIARSELAATTISYNGVDYAIFAGGHNDSNVDTIDVFCIKYNYNLLQTLALS